MLLQLVTTVYFYIIDSRLTSSDPVMIAAADLWLYRDQTNPFIVCIVYIEQSVIEQDVSHIPRWTQLNTRTQYRTHD